MPALIQYFIIDKTGQHADDNTPRVRVGCIVTEVDQIMHDQVGQFLFGAQLNRQVRWVCWCRRGHCWSFVELLILSGLLVPAWALLELCRAADLEQLLRRQRLVRRLAEDVHVAEVVREAACLTCCRCAGP